MTRFDREYVLRVGKGPHHPGEEEMVAVQTFTLVNYKCGLSAGDRLALKRDFTAEDGTLLSAGSSWEVLPGGEEDPDCLWLERPDGELEEFEDGPAIFKLFEKKPDLQKN